MNKLLICIFFLSFSFFSAAQSPIKLGIRAGLNYSGFPGINPDHDPDIPPPSFDYKPGAHVGAVALYKLNKSVDEERGTYVHLQSEIYYSMEGAKMQDTSILLSYLRVIPVSYISHVNKLSWIVAPSFGFLASAKSKIEGGGESDIKEDFRSVDFAIVGGVGFDITKVITLDLRGNWSVKKIGGFYQGAHPSTLSLGLSYYFGKD